MKRFMAALFLMGLLSAPACAEDKYVFILAAHDSPYWTTLGEGIKAAAKEKGISPDILEAQNGRDAEGELNLCLTAVERKPKIIVMGSLNPSIGIQCFQKATAAGILVADVDANLSVAEAKKNGIDLAFSIGSDNYAVGSEAAKFVAKEVAKKDAKILILEGAAGSVPGEKRTNGFHDNLLKLKPAADIKAMPAAWDRLKAMNATDDALLRFPELDVIYAANDVMALGAAEAVRNAKKTARVRVIGVDGTMDARKAVMEGRLAATVAQLPYLIGRRSVELAMEAVGNPAKTGVTETTPTPVLSKNVLETNKDPLLKYVR